MGQESLADAVLSVTLSKIWNVQNKQNYKDTDRLISGGGGWKGLGYKEWLRRAKRFLLEMMKISWNSATTSQPSVLCSLPVPIRALPASWHQIPSFTVFTVTQLWEYTNHCLVNFTAVRFMGMWIPSLKLREENEVGLAQSKCSIIFFFLLINNSSPKVVSRLSASESPRSLLEMQILWGGGRQSALTSPPVHTQAAAPFHLPTSNVWGRKAQNNPLPPLKGLTSTVDPGTTQVKGTYPLRSWKIWA